MSVDDGSEIQSEREVRAGSLNFAPTSRITAPDVTDWHLIADHELASVSKPEGGIIGAIGFAALGAALGALPSGCTAIDKITSSAAAPAESIRSLFILLPAIAAAIICLSVFGIDRWRNSGLVSQIKSRRKYNASNSMEKPHG